jgi:hypothetical protein
VINPFRSTAGHQHDRAQRVTFHALRTAQTLAAANGVAVDCCAAIYEDDVDVVPPWMRAVASLSVSIDDLGTFQKHRRLPRLADVLAAVPVAAPDATHVIYTNVDIALQPDFYIRVAGLLASCGAGVPAFTVTRRILGDHYRDESEYPLMCADPGIPHPGYDCFVFPVSYLPHLRLADVCLGVYWFDMLLLANLDALSRHRMVVLKGQRWTFHIGDDASGWGARGELADFNQRQCERGLQQLRDDGLFWPVASWEGWLAWKLRRPDGRPVVTKSSVVARERLHRLLLRLRCGFNLT